MKLLWLSDLHLNFVESTLVERFLGRLWAEFPDGVIVTGDTAEGRTIVDTLRRMADVLKVPIYFVLGNHDYYHSGVDRVRRAIENGPLADNLWYLSRCGPIRLGPGVALVGHDGWADASVGDYSGGRLDLNDFYLIEELTDLDRRGRRAVMKRLAEEAADHLRVVLADAASSCAHVLVATHVPPFAEASWHEGAPAGAEGLPFFSSPTVGEAIVEVARGYPDCRITVLCGHTHCRAIALPGPGLRVVVAGAHYGMPSVAGRVEVGGAGVVAVYGS